MVPFRGEWTPFIDTKDKIAHFRRWGLIPQKGNEIRPVMVVDGYWDAPEPCTVVGYNGDNWAVIKMEDGIHSIYGEYLAELQPNAYQKLPRSMCFAEVLAKYVVLKIETTGLDVQNDRIIEIAAAIYEYGKKTSEFHSFVDPEMFISTKDTYLTSIPPHAPNKRPALKEIEGEFLDYIEKLPVIGHYINSFDVPFLSTHLSKPIENPVIDTELMAKRVFEMLPNHALGYLASVLHFDSAQEKETLRIVENTNSLLWACLAPRKYEKFVHKAFLDNKLNPNPKLRMMQPKILLNMPNPHNKNIPLQGIPDQYVVFDIETTGFNRSNDKIIEIAAILYCNGEKVDTFHSFVNPCCEIPDGITSLTGITQANVDNAPTIEEIKDGFLSFIGQFPLIGHNAKSFDTPFLSAQMQVPIDNAVIDTLAMARQAFPGLPRYKLEYLDSVLKLGSAGAHRALHDVETTNALLWACYEPEKYDHIVKGISLLKETRRDKQHKRVDIKSIVPSDRCSALNSPLCGKTIVFTGELSIPRNDAMQMAVNAGAILKSGVSQKLDYLVVGTQDIAIVGMDGMSSKELKAKELNKTRKAHIIILSEEEFMKMLSKGGTQIEGTD